MDACGVLLLSVVYLHSPWMHKQFYRGEVVFPGTVYREGGRVLMQGSRLTQAMGKGRFRILFKSQRVFMLDNFLKVKIYPLRSSRFHGICRIKVMMAAFLSTLYSIDKL